MPPMSLLLNLLWIVFGGLWMAIAWLVAAVIMAITIIGLPWARAAHTGQEDLGTGPLGTLGNIIWFVLAGWWLALGHLLFALGHAITIIGLPFAWAHLKLAGLALWPIGKIIVPIDEARRGRFRRYAL